MPYYLILGFKFLIIGGAHTWFKTNSYSVVLATVPAIQQSTTSVHPKRARKNANKRVNLRLSETTESFMKVFNSACNASFTVLNDSLFWTWRVMWERETREWKLAATNGKWKSSSKRHYIVRCVFQRTQDKRWILVSTSFGCWWNVLTVDANYQKEIDPALPEGKGSWNMEQLEHENCFTSTYI